MTDKNELLHMLDQAIELVRKEPGYVAPFAFHLTHLEAMRTAIAAPAPGASPADQGEDARDALMLELLESYEAIFRSAYCQLDADDDLIRRVRAALSASKEPK